MYSGSGMLLFVKVLLDYYGELEYYFHVFGGVTGGGRGRLSDDIP